MAALVACWVKRSEAVPLGLTIFKSRSQKFLASAKRLGSQSLQEVPQSVAALQPNPLAGETSESAIALSPTLKTVGAGQRA
ncbi:MAG: hypothetical protein WBA76_16830 [Phormidesmis sp.]